MQEFEQNHQQRVEVLRGHTSGNVPHETVHEGSEGMGNPGTGGGHPGGGAGNGSGQHH